MRNIVISDITIRKIICGGKVSLLFREKTALAKGIDSFGADIIELPPVKNPKEDALICKTIASFVNNSMISIPAGDTGESINAAYECIKSAKKKCLIISLPVSTVQMEYMYHVKADKMLKKIGDACKLASALCENVEFSALDATRADRGFLISACKCAVESGATAVTICDDAGIFLPEEFAKIVSDVKAEISVPVYVEPSDKIQLGVADSLAAIASGADGVKTAMNSKDSVKTGTLSDALNVHGEKLGVSTNLKNSEIKSDIKALLKNISHTDEKNIISDNDGEILLDAQSTPSDVVKALTVLGYELSEKDLGLVFEALRRVCESRSSIGKKEFEAIIASSAMQVPSTYHLDTFTTVSSNKTAALSNIVLIRGDEKLAGVASGDGPIDSAFNAIEQCVGFHYELDEFSIQAVTEGKEALGSALVRLRHNGKLYSGNGLSSDIVGASIRAYINALNKIVYDEKDQ